MFDQSLFESSERRNGNRRRVTIPLATAIEALFVSALVFIPLMSVEALPKLLMRNPLPLPPRSSPAVSATHNLLRRVTPAELATTPLEIPKFISRIVQKPPQFDSASLGPGKSALPGIPGGFDSSTNMLNGTGVSVPGPPQKAARPTEPVRVGGEVEEARLIDGPKPLYPPLARMARVQGLVRLRAIIGKDGTIRNLTLLTGHPLLVSAALDAVSRWRYQPTLLNGEPVEVETEIAVTFTLND